MLNYRLIVGSIVGFLLGSICTASSQALVEHKLKNYMLAPTLFDAGHWLIPKLASSKLTDDLLQLQMAVALLAIIFYAKPANNKSTRIFTVLKILQTMGIGYFIRSISMLVIVLPNPDTECVSTWAVSEIWMYEVFRIINRQRITCGDLFFSGHTMTSAAFGLAVWNDTVITQSKIINRIFQISYKLFTWLNWFLITNTRLHYTIDVIVAVLITNYVWSKLPLNREEEDNKAANLLDLWTSERVPVSSELNSKV
jgi:PAP2 superfamily C-terminal